MARGRCESRKVDECRESPRGSAQVRDTACPCCPEQPQCWPTPRVRAIGVQAKERRGSVIGKASRLRAVRVTIVCGAMGGFLGTGAGAAFGLTTPSSVKVEHLAVQREDAS